MLTFVGLGLYDERSITLRGRDAVREADAVYAEFYTSELAGTTVEALQATHDVDIEVRSRAGVEQDPEPILASAADGKTAFLTAGDPMISTTHVDLRLRAIDRDIDTRVIHGTTAQTAASSLTGLQNYRFGKATTVPFEHSHGGDGLPESVLATIDGNRDRDLHTLAYLDIDREREEFMTGPTAAGALAPHYGDDLGIVVGQAGSDDPTVVADTISALQDRSFGPPLHLLVVPGRLHPLEREALVGFADGPTDGIPDE